MRHYDKICHNSMQKYAGDGGRCIPCPKLDESQGEGLNSTLSITRISEKVICDGFNHCPNGAGLCFIKYVRDVVLMGSLMILNQKGSISISQFLIKSIIYEKFNQGIVF